MKHDNTIILSFRAAPLLAELLLAAKTGDERLAAEAAEGLQEADPAAATLAPLLLAPYASGIEITVPWLEDLTIYTPLATMPEPVRLTLLLRWACENGARVVLTTRSGARDEEAVERLRIVSSLPRECLELRIDERIHTKLYRARLDGLTVEALSTANLTASEVWKTRTGENRTILRIVRV